MEEVSACSRNCLKFQAIIRNYIIFSVIHGVIKDEYCCPKCVSILKLNKPIQFRCDKVYIGGEQRRFRVLSSGLK